MELSLKLKIENLYKSKDFEDKKSGEITKGKWKIQTFDMIETAEGQQMKLTNISISDEFYEKVKDMEGKEIVIPVGTYINNNQVGYYGL